MAQTIYVTTVGVQVTSIICIVVFADNDISKGKNSIKDIERHDMAQVAECTAVCLHISPFVSALSFVHSGMPFFCGCCCNVCI